MLEENTTCSKCNKPNPAGYQYCLNCGASLYPGEAPTANVLDSDSQQRPGCVTLYAIVLGIGATFSAFIGLMTPFATETASTPPFSERALVLGYFWGSAVVLFILAWGLLRFKEWARVGVILVVVIALLFSLFIAAMAGNLGRIVIQLAIAGYIIHWFGSNDRYFENGDFDQFIKETRWLIATGVISYLVLLGLYPVIQTTRHQIQSQQATATVETVQARATTKAAQATANVQALLATTRFGNEIEGAAYHPNGSQILIVEAHTPEVFDAKTLEKVATLRRHTTWVTGADYSPDGLTVVTADLDCTAKVWDAHYHELTTLTHHTTTTRKGGLHQLDNKLLTSVQMVRRLQLAGLSGIQVHMRNSLSSQTRLMIYEV